MYFCCSIRAVYPKRIKTEAMDSFDVMKDELLRQCLIREIGCNNSNYTTKKNINEIAVKVLCRYTVYYQITMTFDLLYLTNENGE